MQPHVSSPHHPGDHYIGENHHLCPHYHRCTAHFHHQAVYKTPKHNILGTGAPLLGSDMYWCPSSWYHHEWVSYLRLIMSHSPSSCLVFQRVPPRVSVSSSLPTLGWAQECDTLPDKQTHRLSGCTCCQCPDKWRVGGVLSDTFSYFLWFDWGAWAPLEGHKSTNQTWRVFYVSGILCEMFSFHILYDIAVQLVPQELNMNRITRIKTQSSSTCAGWFITFIYFFLKNHGHERTKKRSWKITLHFMSVCTFFDIVGIVEFKRFFFFSFFLSTMPIIYDQSSSKCTRRSQKPSYMVTFYWQVWLWYYSPIKRAARVDFDVSLVFTRFRGSP